METAWQGCGQVLLLMAWDVHSVNIGGCVIERNQLQETLRKLGELLTPMLLEVLPWPSISLADGGYGLQGRVDDLNIEWWM